VVQVVPQVPPAHVAVPFVGTGQTVQLAPQWVGSSSVSRQAPLQFVSGAQPQLLDWQVVPPLHALPHAPQLLLFEVRSAHDPEQNIVPAAQPLAQANVAPEAAQTGVPESGSQAVVHAPQCDSWLRSVSHPSAGLVEQCAQPALQLKVQPVVVQATVEVSTCGNAVQSLLQLPQVWTSLSDTHPAAHWVCPAPQPPPESPAEPESPAPAESSPAAASSLPAPSFATVDPDEEPSALLEPLEPVVASDPAPASLDSAFVDEKSPRIDVQPIPMPAAVTAKMPAYACQNLMACRSSPDLPQPAQLPRLSHLRAKPVRI
jgi:hypothetical protein